MRRALVAGLGGGVLVLVTLASLAGSASSPAPAPEPPPAPPAVIVPPARAAAHRAARLVLRPAAASVLGRAATLAELQYLHAVFFIESSYARGWTGAMVGSHNFGAVGCHNACECIAFDDSHADGTKIHAHFCGYASDDAGAQDAIHEVLVRRPGVDVALRAKHPSTFAASLFMRLGHYYEGFCPDAAKSFGGAVVNRSFQHPDESEGTRACEREAVTAHAKRAFQLAQEVAASLGEPLALRLGSFDEAAGIV